MVGISLLLLAVVVGAWQIGVGQPQPACAQDRGGPKDVNDTVATKELRILAANGKNVLAVLRQNDAKSGAKLTFYNPDGKTAFIEIGKFPAGPGIVIADGKALSRLHHDVVEFDWHGKAVSALRVSRQGDEPIPNLELSRSSGESAETRASKRKAALKLGDGRTSTVLAFPGTP